MKDRLKWLKVILVFQFILFILVILFLFTPLNELSPIAPMLGLISFAPLGLVQFFLTKKNVKEKRLKTALIINGLSSFGVLFFAVIHNLFYALEQLGNGVILVKLLEFLGGTFFVVAIVVCPVVFLVTAVLTIVFFWKNRNAKISM